MREQPRQGELFRRCRIVWEDIPTEVRAKTVESLVRLLERCIGDAREEGREPNQTEEARAVPAAAGGRDGA